MPTELVCARCRRPNPDPAGDGLCHGCYANHRLVRDDSRCKRCGVKLSTFSANGMCAPCYQEAPKFRRKRNNLAADSDKKLARRLRKIRAGILNYGADGTCLTCEKKLGQETCIGPARFVSAFLCGRCNSVLGFAENDPELLRFLANFLETHVCSPLRRSASPSEASPSTSRSAVPTPTGSFTP